MSTSLGLKVEFNEDLRYYILNFKSGFLEVFAVIIIKIILPLTLNHYLIQFLHLFQQRIVMLKKELWLSLKNKRQQLH